MQIYAQFSGKKVLFFGSGFIISMYLLVILHFPLFCSVEVTVHKREQNKDALSLSSRAPPTLFCENNERPRAAKKRQRTNGV